MIFKYKLLTQTQLGQLFGATSHEIGKWLVQCGLRNEKTKRPSTEAHRDGYCDQAPSGVGTGYCWAWDAEKTVKRLVEAGHRLLTELPESLVPAATLNGPFQISKTCPSEVLNGDGTLAARTVGNRNAIMMLKLLELADRHGVINRMSVDNRWASVASS
jgi:hypothetical protein